MRIIHDIKAMQDWSRQKRLANLSIALVPTMGCLHEGHLSLIDIARREADRVIVTIFVNPTQFAENEDLDRYPRTPERDRELCELRGADVLFIPDTQCMYAPDASTFVEEKSLSHRLCGLSRPGHFRGVTSIVAKLFNISLPDIAVFGEKDYQQLQVIRRMTRDLNFPVRIVSAPLIREADGLAMSSRNRYLSAEERNAALSISSGLFALQKAVSAGELDTDKLKQKLQLRISQNGGKVDYIEALDPESLEPVCKVRKPTLFAVAACFGKTRLIDNLLIH